jgi:hypothetical protein
MEAVPPAHRFDHAAENEWSYRVRHAIREKANKEARLDRFNQMCGNERIGALRCITRLAKQRTKERVRIKKEHV